MSYENTTYLADNLRMEAKHATDALINKDIIINEAPEGRKEAGILLERLKKAAPNQYFQNIIRLAQVSKADRSSVCSRIIGDLNQMPIANITEEKVNIWWQGLYEAEAAREKNRNGNRER